MRVVLDTHAAIWYLSDDQRLPPGVFRLLDQATSNGEAITISAISLVEIIYLIERGRIAADTYDRLTQALYAENSSWLIHSVDAPVADFMRTVSRASVPDMPDRIIVATALHLGLPVVTADRQIQSCGVPTIW